jgi:hypothetical protein
MDDDVTSAIAAEVLAYLDAHPDAADTAGGILRWWLSARHADACDAEVEQALERLVACDAVVRQRMADGRTLYARGTQSRDGPGH